MRFLKMLAVCFIAAGVVHATIARDTYVDAGLTNPAPPGTAMFWNHTNSGTLLYVGCWANSGDVITGVTFNSSSMTLAAKVNVTGTEYVYLFRLTSPASGTHAVVVTSTAYSAMICKSLSYSGTDPVQPDTNTTNTASSVTSGSSFATSLTTSVANDWIVGAIRVNVLSSITADAGTSVLSDSNEFDLVDTNGALSAGSHSISVHGSATGNWGGAYEAFKPLSVGGSGHIHHRVTN